MPLSLVKRALTWCGNVLPFCALSFAFVVTAFPIAEAAASGARPSSGPRYFVAANSQFVTIWTLTKPPSRGSLTHYYYLLSTGEIKKLRYDVTLKGSDDDLEIEISREGCLRRTYTGVFSSNGHALFVFAPHAVDFHNGRRGQEFAIINGADLGNELQGLRRLGRQQADFYRNVQSKDPRYHIRDRFPLDPQFAPSCYTDGG